VCVCVCVRACVCETTFRSLSELSVRLNYVTAYCCVLSLLIPTNGAVLQSELEPLCREREPGIFTARRYASTVYAMAASVSLSVTSRCSSKTAKHVAMQTTSYDS